MIRHHEVRSVESLGGTAKKQLYPILKWIKKGVADAKETFTLISKPCDVNGSRQFDPELCVEANAMHRLLKELIAVSVGRSTVWGVTRKGVGVRWTHCQGETHFVDDYDKDMVRHRAFTLHAPTITKRLGHSHQRVRKDISKPKVQRRHYRGLAKKIEVRALAGGKRLKK